MLIVAAEARAAIVQMAAWWRTNRPAAPNLFLRELAAALKRIKSAPTSFAVYRTTREGEGAVRRVLLPKTKNHVYFVHAAAAGLVRVVILWGAVKRRGPPLK
jgi:hypothetical protein